jgi:hypothetical protein
MLRMSSAHAAGGEDEDQRGSSHLARVVTATDCIRQAESPHNRIVVRRRGLLLPSEPS